MSVRAIPAWLVALSATLGCSEDARLTSGRASAPTRERSAVVGGERSGPGIEDAVLLLHTEADGRELVCSASLVAKNLVVTARHCVSHLVDGLFACTTRGELIEADPDAGRLGVHLPAEGFEFFGGRVPHEAPLARGKEVLSTLSETICVNDIAFIVLDRDLDLPILPLRMGSRAERGEAVTLVGYGLDETMDPEGRFDLRMQDRTRRAGLTIASVGPETVDEVTTTPPRMIVLEGPSGCLGDSGGPLFDSDTHALLGIYSLLDGESCVESNLRHLFGHLPSFRALIDDAFEAAGAEPLLESAPSDGGAGGEGGSRSGDAGSAGVSEPGGGGGSVGTAGESGAPSEAAGQPGATPGEGGASGDAPDKGGSAGTAPTPLQNAKRSGGCTLAPTTPRADAGLLGLALAFGWLALRRRRLSAGYRADLRPALRRP